uniref:Ig-like domain-containing protein n=1 Tax=Gouania willdenowi TaxID=441366 RepID=A0A8C5DET3_GOUWI
MVITLAVQTEAPKIQQPKSTEIAVYVGKTVTLECLASGKPPAQISWILPDRTFVRETGTIHTSLSPMSLLQNGTLQIHSANFSSKGDYKCIASNAAGADTITYHLHVAALPPSISEGATDTVNIPVDCVATGLPDPEVSWSLPDGTLINNQMGKKDEGDYTCYAKNQLGKDERKVSIKVGPNAPKIGYKSPSVVTVNLGQSVQLSCTATGDPTPRILWISPRQEVIPASSNKFQIMEDGSLVLKKVTLADEGKYACVARNSVGDDVKNMEIEVEPQEPYINEKKWKSSLKVLGVSYQTVLLDCKVEGKPEPRVWWVSPYGVSLTVPYRGGRFTVHQNGSLELRGARKTDEGKYMCKAQNPLGEASLLVELQVASIAEKPIFAVPNIEIIPIKQDAYFS